MTATTTETSDVNARARALMSAPPPPENGEYHLLCCDCATWKLKSEFNRGGTGKPKPYCKACDYARRREKLKNDPALHEKQLDYMREYRALNADYMRASNRDNYQRHRAERKAYQRAYYAAHRDELVEYQRERRRQAKERASNGQIDL